MRYELMTAQQLHAILRDRHNMRNSRIADIIGMSSGGILKISHGRSNGPIARRKLLELLRELEPEQEEVDPDEPESTYNEQEYTSNLQTHFTLPDMVVLWPRPDVFIPHLTGNVDGSGFITPTQYGLYIRNSHGDEYLVRRDGTIMKIEPEPEQAYNPTVKQANHSNGHVSIAQLSIVVILYMLSKSKPRNVAHNPQHEAEIQELVAYCKDKLSGYNQEVTNRIQHEADRQVREYSNLHKGGSSLTLKEKLTILKKVLDQTPAPNSHMIGQYKQRYR